MAKSLFNETQLQEIHALALELGYPAPVIGPMMASARSLPEDLPILDLADPRLAENAWKQVTDKVPVWQEDNGMALLAVTTAAACITRKKYTEMGISDNIYLDTMKCIPRFLHETKNMYGKWAYDRGFWTWRQTGCLLFRLGTLEFEFRHLEDEEPLPQGLSTGNPVVSVHIPSDAHLRRSDLDHSYEKAKEFFAEVPGAWIDEAPAAILCDSWLLAHTLDILLPDTSGIRVFASDYERYHELQDDDAFFQWLYQLPAPVPYSELAENTSLQRAVKAYLLSGGHMGMAWGQLKSFKL